jgi:SAM-dependent methyltransferase
MTISYQGRQLQLVDRPCGVCDSREHRPIGSKRGMLTSFNFQIVECCKCHFVWVNPGLDDASLISLYDCDYYHGNGFDPCSTYLNGSEAVQDHPCYCSADLAAKISTTARRMGVPGRDVLDVGCGLGALIGELKRLGFDACGLETSSFAVQKCRGSGLEVVNAPLTDRPFGSKQFDIITMIEVIEHVASPRDLLRLVVPLLKPGGMLYIQTGNVEHAFSLLRRVKRGLTHIVTRTNSAPGILGGFSPIAWDYFSLEGHVSYLSPRTLSLLYSQCGLQTVRLPRTRNYGRFPSSLISHETMPVGKKPVSL